MPPAATPAGPQPAPNPPSNPPTPGQPSPPAAPLLPCTRCGRPTSHRAEGRPQHLGAFCTPPTAPHTATPTTPESDPGPPAPVPAPVPAPATTSATTSAAPSVVPAAAAGQPGARHMPADRPDVTDPTPDPEPGHGPEPESESQAARRPYQEPSDMPDLIGRAVAEETRKHPDDPEATLAALVRRAIPDAMTLLDVCRLGGRYDFTAYPPAPDILKKTTRQGADDIWEARPKWRLATLPAGRHQVTALDMNGAYLSALKTHLPIGALQHHTGPEHDRRRAGVHLITPGAWHHDDLPNPLGNRAEPGPLWVAEPTLRLLLRLSGPREAACEAPMIHESWTSGSSENLLEKFRCVLRDARENAIDHGDEITLEYVKTMYSKFVSTMGESNANHAIRRSDWMHIVRAQAFANLWLKAYKARLAGLTVVQVMGTDELHVIGDWRGLFNEGRGAQQVKVKDVYEVGAA
ncbi:transcriptional regulator [Streptacidiphilus sp. MAP12-20]|uniref:transcriptional regulator n=1 Tax=Streptacidiphilus sp. MAP12-20 TaxID=3156299 RepID=UPI0035138105